MIPVATGERLSQERLRQQTGGETGGVMPLVNRQAIEAMVESAPSGSKVSISPVLEQSNKVIDIVRVYLENIAGTTFKSFLQKFEFLNDPRVWSGVLESVCGKKTQSGLSAA